MIINLKQAEIETALKQYITQQGINLFGKETSIAFTAGRKESGISAEINIEDVEIPGFTAPALGMEIRADTAKVKVLGAGTHILAQSQEAQKMVVAPAIQAAMEEEEQVLEQEEVKEEAPVKTTSLFG